MGQLTSATQVVCVFSSHRSKVSLSVIMVEEKMINKGMKSKMTNLYVLMNRCGLTVKRTLEHDKKAISS